MLWGHFRLFMLILGAALSTVQPWGAFAQDGASPIDGLSLPSISSLISPRGEEPLKTGGLSQITLTAQLTNKGSDISHGLVWRVFRPEAGLDGKLPLVASAQGGTSILQLPPGSYLVHVSYGRAGATKRITVGKQGKRESLVLDAGGLKLNAVLSSGMHIPPAKLKFSIFKADAGKDGEHTLIIPNVAPNSVVRLNSGAYHVVSTYGDVNAVIRSDIHVEAGKLTEATVEQSAANITFKLVREAGSEAIVDTSWSVLTESGDPLREAVGAFVSMVLSEGSYTIIAKNRDRIYQRDFTVVSGRNQDVELVTSESAAIDPNEGAD